MGERGVSRNFDPDCRRKASELVTEGHRFDSCWEDSNFLFPNKPVLLTEKYIYVNESTQCDHINKGGTFTSAKMFVDIFQCFVSFLSLSHLLSFR